MNDPVHADDVTHNHFGFLIEIDAILREKGCDEVSSPTALPYKPSVGHRQVTCHKHSDLQMTAKVTF